MFIAFDGTDGVGKTSQVQELCRRLQEINIRSQPYDMGKEGFFDDIFEGIKSNRFTCTSEIRELLYYFEGVLFGNRIVKPLVMSNESVGIVDRYVLSFLSYGPLNGIPVERIKYLTQSMPWPNLYFFIDVPPEVTADRIRKDRKVALPEVGFKNALVSDEETNINNFIVHQKKVYDNFHRAIEMYQKEGMQVIIIDGNQPQNKITDSIYDSVTKILKTN